MDIVYQLQINALFQWNMLKEKWKDIIPRLRKKVKVPLTEQKMSQVERKKWLITLETRLAGYLQKGHQFLEISITDDS